MKIKPISPDDVGIKKNATIPGEVIAAFNQLIIESWSGNISQFTQNKVLTRILQLLNPGQDTDAKFTRQEIFDNGWLDVEDLFRGQGWRVEYDKPAYCETHEAKFTFTKPKIRQPQV